MLYILRHVYIYMYMTYHTILILRILTLVAMITSPTPTPNEVHSLPRGLHHLCGEPLEGGVFREGGEMGRCKRDMSKSHQLSINNYQAVHMTTAFIPFQLLWIIHKPSYRYRKDQFFLGCWFERLCPGHFFETAFGGSCWEWAGQEVPWPWMIGHTMRIHDLVKSCTP